MKITFFLLISPKCVRTHTLVYSLKHIFRFQEFLKEIKEFFQKLRSFSGVKELKELRS